MEPRDSLNAKKSESKEGRKIAEVAIENEEGAGAKAERDRLAGAGSEKGISSKESTERVLLTALFPESPLLARICQPCLSLCSRWFLSSVFLPLPFTFHSTSRGPDAALPFRLLRTRHRLVSIALSFAWVVSKRDDELSIAQATSKIGVSRDCPIRFAVSGIVPRATRLNNPLTNLGATQERF